jgi:nicotinamidase-related amidase
MTMDQNLESLWLTRNATALVVVDVQQRLVPAMDPAVYRRVLGKLRLLVSAAEILALPAIFTEQYPAGLGTTVPELLPQGACVVEKTTFSCCGAPTFVAALEERKIRNILLCGMEAHVCVYQTLLDLRRRGYSVHLAADAISSRNKSDYRIALDNARRAGATVTTTEAALFQILGTSKATEFRAISALIKECG